MIAFAILSDIIDNESTLKIRENDDIKHANILYILLKIKPHFHLKEMGLFLFKIILYIQRYQLYHSLNNHKI